LKELSRSYVTITKDLSQVMNRLMAVYRSWSIPCVGRLVYTPRQRATVPSGCRHYRRLACAAEPSDSISNSMR
jgi:hypothetical protein